MTLQAEVGIAIKSLHDRGYTQQAIADTLHVSQGYVSKVLGIQAAADQTPLQAMLDAAMRQCDARMREQQQRKPRYSVSRKRKR